MEMSWRVRPAKLNPLLQILMPRMLKVMLMDRVIDAPKCRIHNL